MDERRFQVGSKALLTQGDRVFLMKSQFESTKEPCWDLPGGRLHVDDKDIHRGLIRELEEELPGIQNIRIHDLVDAAILPRPFPDGSGLLILFWNVTATLPNPIVLTEEHTHYQWITRDQLAKIYNNKNRTDIFDEAFYRVCQKALTTRAGQS